MHTQEINLYISYLTYAVNFLTIVGSILSFIIFSRRAFERSTIGIYCRALAIFDLFVIFNFSVGIASIAMNYPLMVNTDWLCKTISYISPVFSSMSGWTLVAFSLDQLITVSLTKRFIFFKKIWFQYSLILGLFILHCLIFTPMIFSSSVTNKTIDANISTLICNTEWLALPIIILVEGTFIPFVILFILTAIIVGYLAKSRSQTINQLSSSLPSVRNQMRRRRKEFKYAFNSVILNIMHILLTSPITIIASIHFNDIGLYIIIAAVGYFIYSLNFALHFWIHFLVNSFFRNELFILFRIRN